MSDKVTDQVASGGSDQAIVSGDSSAPASKQEDKVAYETYRKTVDAEKKAKAKADELQKELQKYKEAEMSAQGKSQELIDSLRTQVKEKDTKLQDVVGTFAYRSVAARIREEAIKNGCLDVDLLLKAGSDEFSKIEVDAENGFSVNDSDLKNFFDTTMGKHPTLFKKAGPKIHSSAPSVQGHIDAVKPKKTIEQMAVEFAQLNNVKQ